MGNPAASDPRRDALAREIVERRTGMPAYLASDEDWAAAEDEAMAADLPPEKPEPPLLKAVRLAKGDLRTEDEIAASIGFLNKASAAIRRASGGGDSQ